MPDVPIGTIVAYGGAITDNGGIVVVPGDPDWLLCNGAAVSSAQFPRLHASINLAHGNGSEDGNGGANFNLPDLRGLFLRGVSGRRDDRDPDRNSRAENHPGGNTGNNVGSIQDDQFASHTHPPGRGTNFPTDEPGGLQAGGTQVGTTSRTGSAGGNETRPKNAYINYIIRAS